MAQTARFGGVFETALFGTALETALFGGATTGMSIINIAFGANGVGTETEFNAITSLATGVKAANLNDSAVSPTGVSIEFLNAWSNSATNTVAAPVHGYPVDAANEYFDIPGVTPRNVVLTFPSAHWGLAHTITVWGATTSTGGTRDGSFIFTDSAAGALGSGIHNAENDGAAVPLQIPFTMPSDGVVNMSAGEADPSDIAAYLSVMTISYTLATGSPTLTTPYPNLSNNVGDVVSVDLATNWANPSSLHFDIFQAPDSAQKVTGLPGLCRVEGEATARRAYQTQVMATDVLTGIPTLSPAFTWSIERLAALGSVANNLASLSGPAVGVVTIAAFDAPVTALASGTDLIPRYLYARVTGDVVLIGLDGVQFTHTVTAVGIQEVGFVQINSVGTTGTIDDYDGLV